MNAKNTFVTIYSVPLYTIYTLLDAYNCIFIPYLGAYCQQQQLGPKIVKNVTQLTAFVFPRQPLGLMPGQNIRIGAHASHSFFTVTNYENAGLKRGSGAARSASLKRSDMLLLALETTS